MNSPTTSTRAVAIFDFDDTLVHGDSLWPFLVAVAGWPRVVVAMALALLRARAVAPQHGLDRRGMVKQELLRRILAGRSPESLQPALATLAQWPRWKTDIVARLHAHHEAGCHIVIASGGLALYLPTLLRDIPHHALICTEVEIVAGRFTGFMREGNCVRLEKARRVADYLAAQGGFIESWGYGNAPHDVPMLALMQHKMIV